MGLKSVYSAFTAGEVSEEYFSRTDLARFSYGAAKAENFFVDYRGGMVSRPGFEYAFPCPHEQGRPKFVRFFGSFTDLLLVFSDNRMRVVKEGGYVLEAATAITAATRASSCVVTSTSHGLNVNDLVYISGVGGMSEINARYFRVSAATTNTINLETPDGEAIDSTIFGAYTSGGTVARVYTLTVPYIAEQYPDCRFEQRLNDLYITSLAVPPRKITYTSDTSWAVSVVDFYPEGTPTGLTITSSAAGTTGAGYAVSSVIDGVESIPCHTVLSLIARNSTGDSNRVEWAAVAQADTYNIYRSLWLSTANEVIRSDAKGFIGRVSGTQFVDPQIDPDFTKIPPKPYTPFTPGAITAIQVTARGSGYLRSNTVAITDPDGSGFVGELSVNADGEVIAITIINPGSGYTSPSISITTAGGSGATFVISKNPATGTYPLIYRTFQQRGIWAATTNNPITVWGSKPGAPENLTFSDVLQSDDAYIYTLDADVVKPIKHITAIRSGLLIFTEAGVVQLLPSSGKVITPLNASAEEQAFIPVSDVAPIRIGLDVLFTEDQSPAVHAMQYTEYTETFQLQDIAVLSAHLLRMGQRPTKMVYWAAPHKLIWFLREDGNLVSCTYDRSQELFGWAEHKTKGYFRDLEVIKDSDGEALYTLVERYINGQWRYFGERSKNREIYRDEDAFCVDCGLGSALTPGPTGITFSTYSGVATGTATTAGFFFGSEWIGRILFVGEGKFLVTAVPNPSQITGEFLRPLPESVAYSSPIPYNFAPLNWTYGTPTTVVGNLWHLEGQMVSVQADGDAFINRQVVNGQITLDYEATKIVVGLAYNCDLKTLPLTNNQVQIEGADKRVMGLHFRRLRSRGLFIGPSFDDLREVKERGDTPWGDSLGLRSEVEEISLNPGFDYDSSVCFRQSWPLPCTITGLIFDVEVSGD